MDEVASIPHRELEREPEPILRKKFQTSPILLLTDTVKQVKSLQIKVSGND